MAKKLEGKVAIVTGASKGIGASIAEELAQQGASVVVNYSSSKESAEKVVQKIKQNGGKAIAVKASLSEPTEIDHLFSETKKNFGKLDILINNAGIFEFLPLQEVTPEHFHKHFDLNVLGLLLASKAAEKHFGSSGGSIVNISSVNSTGRIPNSSVYSATKGAVDSLTRSLAAELGSRKIRINSINPGMVQTEGTKDGGFLDSEFRKKYEETAPLGRIGVPKDIAPAVVFLVSDDASWITGETLFISGGLR
jgi:3-oxoacyl-[acyl-carrier protein] reductase